MKLAQVERAVSGLRLSEALVIQRRMPISSDDGEEPPPVTSEEEIRTALSLGKEFSGRKAACTLSMCLCDLRTLEVPLSKEAEQRSIIAAELSSTYGNGQGDRAFDFWQTDAPGDEPAQGSENVAVLSASQQWVAQVADDLSKAGFRCQALDGLPLVLARVVQMSSASRSRKPVSALDWGFASATFCVVIDGRPVFVRRLRNCGLGLVAQSACRALGVSLDEAQRLLTEHGLPKPAGNDQTRDDAQLVTADVAAGPLSAMVDELNRTLSFLKGQRPAFLPARIWLFGGGATVKNVTGFLTAKVGVPVDVWRLASAGIQNHVAAECPAEMLGPAIALSSLAWVKQ